MFFVDSIVNQYGMVVQGDKVLICNYFRTEVDVNVIQVSHCSLQRELSFDT